MQWITGDPIEWLGYFLLILLRMSGLFVLSPILGRANIPVITRLGLSLLLSFIVVSILPRDFLLPFSGAIGFILACVLELLVGLTMGYLTTLFFSAVFVGGQIIDMQIGLGMVQIFDPQTNIQVPIVGSLLNIILLLAFLITDGHLKLIQIIIEFYDVAPPGHLTLDPNIAGAVVIAFVRVFVLGLSIAIPFIASGLLAEVGLGIMVRIAPQLNIFVLGIPVKTIIGFVLLVLIVPIFVSLSDQIFDELWESMDAVLMYLAPSG